MINKNSKIYVAGHNGMVGSSVIRLLKKKNYKNILTRSREQLDLTDQNKTFLFLKRYKPDVVIIAAAKVGGIYANNKYRADFLYKNLQIQNNLIHGSYLNNIKKLIFLGSSCIYPKYCKQPIRESYLLSGDLEHTNEPYAIAKIAGLKMCENYNSQYNTNYISLMPCNLYGPNDNYDLNNSHFLPAFIRKVYEANKYNNAYVTIWGDGNPKRELLYVDDLASAILHFMKVKTKESLINIGSGKEYSITAYLKKIMKVANIRKKINFDLSKPNGTPRKLLDSSIAHKYGWYPKIDIDSGLNLTWNYFKEQNSSTN